MNMHLFTDLITNGNAHYMNKKYSLLVSLQQFINFLILCLYSRTFLKYIFFQSLVFLYIKANRDMKSWETFTSNVYSCHRSIISLLI